MRGAKRGNVRRIGLTQIEHDGSHALVASRGGDPAHPAGYHNKFADPGMTSQDGPKPRPFVVREAGGDQRAAWWQRAADVNPQYLE
jgi:deazaflavin-dependent oxidoreductase (nitroreductase family)